MGDQVEELDQLISLEGDGSAFYERTFITEGMRQLLTEAIARLAGKSNDGIFHLKQAMGGGKTHLLLGLGLVARNQDLRRQVCAGIPYLDKFDTAKVVAFNGRKSPEHYLWGEVASQLGKGGAFKRFWDAGPIAPDPDDWTSLLEDQGPVLVLLDELPPYFDYLRTRPSGSGTVADIATRALSSLFVASRSNNQLCVVISDLSAAYSSGSQLINSALQNLRQEIGRQERSITPVDLSGNEIYEILRKRLFTSLPDAAIIGDVSEAYAKALNDGEKAKVLPRGAEAIADEISSTYPFHPQLKHLIALFKENERFKQTRGLIEIASRLIDSVWSRTSNDVSLIGAQHFDFSIQEVRSKLGEIGDMTPIIAHDIWGDSGDACAQRVDSTHLSDAASQVASLLYTASLSTAVNAVKGISKEELWECLVDPLRPQDTFAKAFDDLETECWYLHHSADGRYYFDRQENLLKMLQTDANNAPPLEVDRLIKTALRDLFEPKNKTAYQMVLPLASLEEVMDSIRRNRVLLIVSPESKLPPEAVVNFFAGLAEKNNLLVLTGEKTQIASLDDAARKVFAAIRAERRITETHTQRKELEEKQREFQKSLIDTVLALFDQLFFPIQQPGREPQLYRKPLTPDRDQSKPFNGEEQIVKTLTSDPSKLHLDVKESFVELREKAEQLLWFQGSDHVSWENVSSRSKTQSGMPWVPPGGLEDLKNVAFARGLWQDLGNGNITKRPQPKKTSCQILVESGPDDHGLTILKVIAQDAGPTPIIYFQENGTVTEQSPQLDDDLHSTQALRISFLVIDPTGKNEAGPPFFWENKLAIRNRLENQSHGRSVALLVAPAPKSIRYSLDGSSPREGKLYEGPIGIGMEAVTLYVFAENDGIEAVETFKFPAADDTSVKVDPIKPVEFKSSDVKRILDSREAVFEAIEAFRREGAQFGEVQLVLGGKVQFMVTDDCKVGAEFLESLLEVLQSIPDITPDAPLSLKFKSAHFPSGHAFSVFMEHHNLQYSVAEVRQ